MAAGFFRRRVFAPPFDAPSEAVGLQSMLFAAISGPFYYWKKRARIEAVLIALSGLPLLVYDPSHALLSRAMLTDLASAVWALSVVLAPLLLALSYRRQGWSERGE